MTRRLLSAAGVAALVAGAALLVKAGPDFSDLDLSELQAQSKEYRHRADLLRKMVGLRERKIGEIQTQADALVRQAQADAQRRAQLAAGTQQEAAQDNQVLGFLGQIMPGGGGMMGDMMKSGMTGLGNGMVAAANAQAQQASAQGATEMNGAAQGADNLKAQADAYQGEKKKLVYKAHQYEQLADAKDLLAASEILRQTGRDAAKALENSEQTVEAERRYVEGMTLW